MSSQVFPTFPLREIALTRSEVYDTRIYTSASGKIVTSSSQASPRYRYEINIAALRQHGSLTEVATILAFWRDHRGRWDSFLFDDPFDATRRRCRFASDDLVLTRLASGYWEAQAIVLESEL